MKQNFLLLVAALVSIAANAQNWDQIIKTVGNTRSANSSAGRSAIDNFGVSVAIDGNYAVVGASNEDEDANGGNTLSDAGSVILFENIGGTWTQIKKLVASDRATDDYFGYSVAISGGTVVVGAYGDDEDATGENTLSSAGSAYIFSQNEGGADNWGQVKKLVAADRASDDFFGFSVAISGSSVVVGALFEDEDAAGANTLSVAGSAYIFSQNEGGANNWGQVKKLVAADRAENDNFGISVAICGSTVVVGAYLEDEDAAGSNTRSNAGAAYIFSQNEGGVNNWGQVKKLVAADRAATDNFGISVAISGSKVVVGASAEDQDALGANTRGDAGSAYIFSQNEGGTNNWGQVKKLVAADRAQIDYFGSSVAISGSRVVVGAPVEDEDATGANTLSGAGSAYMFSQNEGGTFNWGQQQKIVMVDKAINQYYGYSVAIDGDFAVVGAYQDPTDAAGANAVVGAGAAYVLRNINGTWTHIKKLVATDRAVNDNFGFSVAISGNTVVVGAYTEDEDASGANRVANAGSAYIFSKDQGGTDNWGQVKKLVAANRGVADWFGYSVAISGSTVVVGASSENEDADELNTRNDAGAAYIFSQNEGGPDNWGQVKKLVAADRAESDYFGHSVAISGSTVVVGAYIEDEDAAGANTLSVAGSAYIFSQNEGGANNWGQVKKLVAADRAEGVRFGISVAISGGTVVVGADREKKDGAGINASTDAGAAYIFSQNEGGANNWGQVKKLVAADRSAGDQFGNSVAMSGNTIVVGARGEDEDVVGANTLSNAGSAYVFSQNEGGVNNWGQVKKLVAADRAVDDQFGISVAISGGTVVVGAWFEDEDAAGANNIFNAGAAYFYKDFGSQPSIRYVRAGGAGTGDGLSWANASADPQAMINASAPGDEVWIAAGTYKPNAYPSGCTGCSTNRDFTFHLKDGVKLYGGFSASSPEATVASRNIAANPTILSGDFNNDDVISGSGSTLSITGNGENAYHVVLSISDGDGTVLDGFTIRGGNADVFSIITVESKTILRYSGAGMYNQNASPIIMNTTFNGNSALDGGGMSNIESSPSITTATFIGNSGNNGGGMFNGSSSPTIINTSFTGNKAEIGGGLINFLSSNPGITNTTFTNNSATSNGGGIFNFSSNPNIRNSILWGNVTEIANSISGGGSSSNPTVLFSIVQGDYIGTGNLDVDPLFINAANPAGPDGIHRTADDGIRLQSGSPAINSGDNSLIPSGITTDITGADRIQGGTVDMGAYELEPLPDYTITTTGSAIVITDISGNGETLDVSESGSNIRFEVTPITRTYRINGGAITAFTTPADVALAGINAITINAAGGNDNINMGAFAANLPSLTINGGTGDDEVNFNGDIPFAANANLDVDMQNDDAAPGLDAVFVAANANLILTGTGTATVKVSRSVLINSGGSIETADGNLTIEANQQAMPSSGNFVGVRLINGVLKTSGIGLLEVKGKGGNSDANNRGVFVDNAGKIEGGSGTVMVQGTGGAASGNNNHGVYVLEAGSRITSSGGAVSVTGQGGGTSASGFNCGVYVQFAGEITDGGSGTVTVQGTGGAASGNRNLGVFVANAARITSSGGAVSVTGQGGGTGTSGLNYGVWVSIAGQITAGGSGTVTVQGTGGAASGNENVGVGVSGANSLITSSGGAVSVTGQGGGTGASGFNYGVFVFTGEITAGGSGTVTVHGTGGAASGNFNYGVFVVGANSRVTSLGGAVSVTGIERGGTSGFGIRTESAGIITTATNGGNIALIANSLSIESAVSTNGGGSTTLRPYTNGVQIDLGNASDPIGGPLGLSDTELDLITTGTLIIGDANSGAISISSAISFPAATNVQLRSGGDITFNQNINTNGGTLLLAPGTFPAAVKPTFTGTDATASTVSFASDLSIAINGTTPGDGTSSTFTRLTVAGSVDLTGVDLVLSGTHTPLLGETFTIVDNDGTDAIMGTFSGLPEGGIIPDFLGSGLEAIITYTGGDGNDAVISVCAGGCILTWTGAVNNLWNVAGNWNLNRVPTTDDDILIPLGSPQLNTDFTLGGNLTLNGTGTLTVAPNKTLTISGSADFGNRPVIIKSTGEGDGSIGQITGTLVNADNVTVERFIPPTVGRAWRLLTIPVNSSTATIRDVWAGGAALRVSANDGDGVSIPAQPGGTGTIITGHAFPTALAANTAGYDWWPALWNSITGRGGETSIKRYQPSPDGGGRWPSNVASRSTIGTVINAADPAYMLFVRGDRTVTTGNGSTTLVPTGTLKTGNVMQQVPATSSAKFFTYGNPYASTIDFALLEAENTGKIAPLMLIWNAGLNGWQTVIDIAGIWTAVPGGVSTGVQYIQSGQGVMLQTTSLTATTMTTKELHKTNGISPITPFDIPGRGIQPGLLFADLHARHTNGSRKLLDGVLAVFASENSHHVADVYDVSKMGSLVQELGVSFIRNGVLLGIEGRPPVSTNWDTLYLNIPGLTTGNFSFSIHAQHLAGHGAEMYLLDKYLGITTALNNDGTTYYDFEVNNHTGTGAEDRFLIVQRLGTILPVNFVTLRAIQHQENIQVSWEAATEVNMSHYEVMHSLNGTDFGKATRMEAKNISPAHYHWLHVKPGSGNHFYKVNAIDAEGKMLASKVVKVRLGAGLPTFTAYPNPIEKSHNITLDMEAMPAGTYSIQFMDASGRVLQAHTLEHRGGSAAQLISLPKQLASGKYFIRLSGNGLNEVRTMVKL